MQWHDVSESPRVGQPVWVYRSGAEYDRLRLAILDSANQWTALDSVVSFPVYLCGVEAWAEPEAPPSPVLVPAQWVPGGAQ